MFRSSGSRLRSPNPNVLSGIISLLFLTLLCIGAWIAINAVPLLLK